MGFWNDVLGGGADGYLREQAAQAMCPDCKVPLNGSEHNRNCGYAARQAAAMRNTNTEAYRTEQAVLAERERCAQTAEDETVRGKYSQFDTHGENERRTRQAIAAKIRSGQ